jgi:hypothetical protein
VPSSASGTKSLSGNRVVLGVGGREGVGTEGVGVGTEGVGVGTEGAGVGTEGVGVGAEGAGIGTRTLALTI